MQTHLNVPGSSRQDPSLWQGCDSHSFTFVSHLGPVNPWVQLQAKLPGVFTQMPSCSHGDPGNKTLNNALHSYTKTMDKNDEMNKFDYTVRCAV